jgi:molecular chaperone Hsp33
VAERRSTPGVLRRFLLEAHPVRGQWVRLGDAWNELRNVQTYPPVVESLLGQTVTAAVLLAATLKFDGKLTLQLSGNGRVPLLVAQCTHDFDIRATATHDAAMPTQSEFSELVGDGRLAVTIEASSGGTRYQGIVPLATAGVAASLESYFEQSEQLPTRLLLANYGDDCAGLLIQKLPAAEKGEASGAVTQTVWEELQAEMAQLELPDLLLPAEPLLARLCGTHDCRLFAPTPVRFHCSCSLPRVSAVLRSLGLAEARETLLEQGSVTITCEFCHKVYRFDAVDVERLFAADATAMPDALQRQ